MTGLKSVSGGSEECSVNSLRSLHDHAGTAGVGKLVVASAQIGLTQAIAGMDAGQR
jgi:hypothetical protein